LPPPTETSTTQSARAVSGKISSIGSAWSRSSLPPLRERLEDVRSLAEYFISRYAIDLAGGHCGTSDSAIQRLESYSWPGNVRELENAIRRALVLSSGGVLTADDFDFLTESPGKEAEAVKLEDLVAREARDALSDDEPNDLYRRLLDRVEIPLLETVLQHTGGNQIRAAAMLGINRNTLRKKIAELSLSVRTRTRS